MRRMDWGGALLALGGLALASCGDDAAPVNAQAQAEAPDAGADSSHTTTPDADPDGAPDADTAPDAADSPPDAADGPCPGAAVTFTTPATTVQPWEDTQRAQDGVQVDVRVEVALPGGSEGALVTVEHLGRAESYGATVQGGAALITGLTLEVGLNRLAARADGADCWGEGAREITLEPGTRCAGDLDCPWGAACGGGWCRPCQTTCAGDDACASGEVCAQGCGCEARYSRVLIEDLHSGTGGSSPGADLDAVGLTPLGGSEIYASRVEGAQVPTVGNDFADPSAALGPPDADCRVQNFVSLGGRSAGGYIIVSFGDGERRLALSEGDLLTIYEVGRRLCPGSTYQDEPYRVAVSASTQLDTFVEIGQGGPNDNVIPIPQLP